MMNQDQLLIFLFENLSNEVCTWNLDAIVHFILNNMEGGSLYPHLYPLEISKVAPPFSPTMDSACKNSCPWWIIIDKDNIILRPPNSIHNWHYIVLKLYMLHHSIPWIGIIEISLYGIQLTLIVGTVSGHIGLLLGVCLRLNWIHVGASTIFGAIIKEISVQQRQ